MKDRLLERISDSIALSVPLFYKKLMRGGHGRSERRASYLEAPILCMLQDNGPMPMSVIGKRLNILRPNMTSIVDKLIAEGKVNRAHDEGDRRVVYVSITKKGSIFMKEHMRAVKGSIKANLTGLSLKDLKTLSSSLENIRSIVGKIDEPDEYGKQEKDGRYPGTEK